MTAYKADILIQALPYFQKYSGRIVVIKYGGNAMVSEELREAVMSDIVLLTLVGVKVVLVHGGGPEITATLKRMGIESRFSGGLRVTDAETVQVVQMVLSGKTNKDLVALIQKLGGKAIGISGIDGGLIRANGPLKPELGFVGEPDAVDPAPILDILHAGYIPIIATVGSDADGQSYNINADTAASAIAGSLNAENLIVMTDIRGLMRDKSDPDSFLPHVSVAELAKLIESGAVEGGMIPKVNCCADAVKQGVSRAVMIDGRIPHAILLEMFSDEGIGTLVTDK
jgi:acetylglutamate kinase